MASVSGASPSAWAGGAGAMSCSMAARSAAYQRLRTFTTVKLMAVAQSPANPFSAEQVTVIKNPGKENMEVIVKDGQKIEHYKASGEIGEGQGAKAGVAYKLKDGSMVYVPEPGAAPAPTATPR